MTDSRPARPGLARALAQCRHLDWREPGLWPPLPRRALCVLVALLAALPAWTLLSAGAEDDLQAARAREPALRQALVERLAQAAQGTPLQRRRQALQDEVAALERDLPPGVELDALLAALHRAALRQGLQVELIRPEPASGKAGADDAPVALRLSGGYHALGAFAAEVAALAPPVTLHELQLGANARDAALTLEATARGHRRPDAAAAARLAAPAAREMRP
ncbi:type 4a pilus biogenesis protein PilO [Azohydromonas aeria]|uniref:type 4a pilus biogenesis protein PilO n=1 Tax=Azohydromonas aeria TaxID=2590212 RepID=UPI0012F932C5|nr:type 4a pilus biogenesis protein PilO [Azohydromonas aeria]